MRILFVCTGNTCRSCMAEAIFNKLNNLDNIEAYSAGISVVNNSKTSKYSSILVMENCNIDISEREAVQLTTELLENSDLVLTMTSYMSDLLSNKFPHLKKKIYSLNEYVGTKGDIVDPYGGDISVYEETCDALNKSIRLLLDKLKEDKGIS